MSRLWCIAPLLVVGMFWGGFLMGDDKKEPIYVRASMPRYYSQLGLTPKQKNEVFKIRGKSAAEIQELYQKINDLKEQEKHDCEKVLTAAQKARLRELLVGGKKGADDEDPPIKADKKTNTESKNKQKGVEEKRTPAPVEIKK